jgi:hypothetical protein
MICPNCKKQYEKGMKKCPVCNSELIQASDEEHETVEAMRPVKVASVANSIEANLILNLLQSNDIQCLKKDIGSGSYMNLYLGFSVFGEDIYVDEKDSQRAKSLINDITEKNSKQFSEGKAVDGNEEAEDVPGNNASSGEMDSDTSFQEEDSYSDYAFYRNPRILARIFLIAILGLGVVGYILSKVL